MLLLKMSNDAQAAEILWSRVCFFGFCSSYPWNGHRGVGTNEFPTIWKCMLSFFVRAHQILLFTAICVREVRLISPHKSGDLRSLHESVSIHIMYLLMYVLAYNSIRQIRSRASMCLASGPNIKSVSIFTRPMCIRSFIVRFNHNLRYFANVLGQPYVAVEFFFLRIWERNVLRKYTLGNEQLRMRSTSKILVEYDKNNDHHNWLCPFNKMSDFI